MGWRWRLGIQCMRYVVETDKIVVTSQGKPLKVIFVNDGVWWRLYVAPDVAVLLRQPPRCFPPVQVKSKQLREAFVMLQDCSH
jgi:hypothetical protein